MKKGKKRGRTIKDPTLCASCGRPAKVACKMPGLDTFMYFCNYCKSDEGLYLYWWNDNGKRNFDIG